MDVVRAGGAFLLTAYGQAREQRFSSAQAAAYERRGRQTPVRRQNIWHNSRRKTAKCGLRPDFLFLAAT